MSTVLNFLCTHLDPNHLRPSLLLVTPNETTFPTMDEVPNYVDKVMLWFLLIPLLEFLLSDDDKVSFNDSVTNLNASILNLLFKFGGRFLAAVFYEDIYNNYALISLPWESPWTWILCLFVTDFLYYLTHRAQHEIGIFWAFHQVHHSSEFFNMAISMRHGAIQDITSVGFELMQVFFIPPNVYLAHRYMMFLRMFWLHASFLPDLGPFEYILVTPKTHSVHHGRNKYCIDKNYGGTFIFWDMMFGTYAAPKDDEELAYGLVEPIRSFNQLWLQNFEFKVFGWDKPNMKDKDGNDLFPGFWNKVKTVFMPPGYFPGVETKWFFFWKHNVDPTEGIPELTSEDFVVYNPPLTKALKAYLTVNVLAILVILFQFSPARNTMSWTHFILTVGFLIERIQMFGYYFDHHRFATLFDVTTMFITIQIASYFAFPLTATCCKCCIVSALLLAWCGLTHPKQKSL